MSRNPLPRGGAHSPIRGTGQITTLTRISICEVTQFSETNRSGLETKDEIDIFEESASNKPGIRTGVRQGGDSPGAN